MKQRNTSDSESIQGLYINDFARGFFGEHNEGNAMLKSMGLPSQIIPFSVAVFLKQKMVQWKDSANNIVTISYEYKDNQLLCQGEYLKKKKLKRLVFEWGYHESSDMIARLESESIGNLCMKCISEIIL